MSTPSPERWSRIDGKSSVELYLDTSALVKLYLVEPNRETVIAAVQEASRVTTSMVAYAEARSAFARRLRENTVSIQEHDRIVQAFNTNWIQIDRVPVSDDLTHAAGDLAQRLALRGLDALHLASAVWMTQHFSELSFLAFDDRLMSAARQILPVYETG